MTEQTVETGAKKKPAMLQHEIEAKRLGLYMSLPAQLLLAFIVAFPFLMQVYISLTWWGPLDGTLWTLAYESMNWFGQYGEIFQDGRFWGSIGRTFAILGIAVPIEFLLGLGLAMLFVQKFPGRPIFYSIMLTPMMIVPAVTGLMFFLLFQGTGPINDMLGLPQNYSWLQDINRSMITIIIADVWQWTPLMFLILLAGILGVPEDQLRMASILGAGKWTSFVRIVLPKMKTVMIIALVIRVVESFKIFDTVYIMTRGGPGVATETISLYIYKMTFADLEWSYVAAMGLFILVALSLLAVLGMWQMSAAQKRQKAMMSAES
ncbi:MAG: sugar ABC transporter permease [Rhodospirillaceae bacterium]|jgi:multiple sugar transport system permease protein|nr:sugar ABC transporter permease [Rhodospirillaceae bacterium]MBT6442074.1 sugar ABC transporter permease [Alphaproteobacteria bacterium]